MRAIEAERLGKTFYVPRKSPGMAGAIKGLFTRKKVAIEAVRDIDLTIDQGEMVGFLGPNGAGKTTTLKMLTGILHPTTGSAKVLGHVPHRRDPDMLKRLALVMGNKMSLWWDLPAWDGFLVLKEIYEVEDAKFKPRVERLIETLQVSDKIHTQLRKLSLGERMKCELVAALIHAPQLVFLDEPTLGLDVVSQKRIREFLRDFHREENCTIVLTSHYMQDVQELCDRVVVIDHGQLVFDGTLDSLAARFVESRRLRLSLGKDVERADLERFGAVVSYEDGEVVLDVPREKTAAITAAALQALPVLDIAVEEVSIEEVVRSLFDRPADGKA
ncbi:MAG: ATP-binding cassette domain-containing protein [Fimbriimonadaceae bacterium]